LIIYSSVCVEQEYLP